jgi:hypothetical protein
MSENIEAVIARLREIARLARIYVTDSYEPELDCDYERFKALREALKDAACPTDSR